MPSAHRHVRLCFACAVIVAIQLAVLLRLLYTLSRELLDGSSLNLVIRPVLRRESLPRLCVVYVDGLVDVGTGLHVRVRIVILRIDLVPHLRLERLMARIEDPIFTDIVIRARVHRHLACNEADVVLLAGGLLVGLGEIRLRAVARITQHYHA